MFSVRLSFLLVLLFALVGSSLAQTVPTTTVPETLANPRATLTTFFTAMNETPPNLVTAATTLDLSQEPAVIRETFGQRTAVELFAVFNRTKYIDLKTVPNNPDATEYAIALPNNEGEIRLVKDSDGAWRFSPNTVAKVHGYWLAFRDQEVVGNLKDVKPSESLPVQFANERLSEWWRTPAFYGLEPWKWLGILLALVASYIVALIVKVIIKTAIALKVKKFGQLISPHALKSAGNGIFLVTGGLIFNRLTVALELVPDIRAATAFFSEVVLTVGFAWIGFALTEYLITFITPKMADSERAERLFLPIIRNLARIIVIGIALMYFLQRIGFDITGLIAGLGIGGLVVALAAKDSVENIFGSLTVLFEMPFQIGDWVIVSDHEGIVEDISIRSVTLRTFYDSVILIPNSQFINNPIENMGRRRFRRIKTTLGITYDATPDEIENFVNSIREYLNQNEHTWKEKNNVAFNEYGASDLVILVQTFIDASDFTAELKIREEILLEIMRIAERCKVEFAYPTQRMIVAKQDENPLE